jgi:hypothetical protein
VLQPGYGFDSEQIWIAATGIVRSRYGTESQVWSRGVRNVAVVYRAGFVRVDEAYDAPTSTPYQISPDALAVVDLGVKFADTKAALTKVSGIPATGQYAWAEGIYTFSSSDTTRQFLISYSFIPNEIEQACIDLIALRMKERDRIGVVSKAVGTETVSFSQKDMPDSVQTLLNQYRKVYAFA